MNKKELIEGLEKLRDHKIEVEDFSPIERELPLECKRIFDSSEIPYEDAAQLVIYVLQGKVEVKVSERMYEEGYMYFGRIEALFVHVRVHK